MKMRKLALAVTSLALAGLPARGAAVAAVGLDARVQHAVIMFEQTNSRLRDTFQQAYGYAVFPNVGKGAAGIGGAFGDGEVFAQGKLIGTARMTQVTLGAQLGGQEYAEVVFFETKQALDEFKAGKLAMAAEASAVAAASGASADAKYRYGVLIMTLPENGLMFEASVGGQKFSFLPNNPR